MFWRERRRERLAQERDARIAELEKELGIGQPVEIAATRDPVEKEIKAPVKGVIVDKDVAQVTLTDGTQYLVDANKGGITRGSPVRPRPVLTENSEERKLRALEFEFRNNPDPVARETAWDAIMRMEPPVSYGLRSSQSRR